MTLEDLHRFYQVLVTCGATIEEINTLRKHVSAVKGGRLAAKAVPAAQVTLYVSDVPDGFPATIASGPTMPDESTNEDCQRILTEYNLFGLLPESVRVLFESGRLAETPDPYDPIFSKSTYVCLMSNSDGIHAIVKAATMCDIHAEVDVTCDEWHFQQAAEFLLNRLGELRSRAPNRKLMLVSGGELSSPVTGAGQGGRNQAFVLECAKKMAGMPFVVLSAGTDGIDGNSPAAGAIADGETVSRAEVLGMDPDAYLVAGDSYSFFHRLGDSLVIGPTGTNVRDLRILLAYA